MDDKLLSMMQRLAPDLTEEMGRRALVLERIAVLQPVGRRALASRLRMPEREVRQVAGMLRAAGYIAFDAAGMTLTKDAGPVLEAARMLSAAMRGIAMLESQLARLLHIARVVVVPGNADEEPRILQEVGRAAAQRLPLLLRDGDTLALTGGNTMLAVAQALQPAAVPLRVLVLPARGGLGRAPQTQAGAVAALVAQKLGGQHRLLHVPDVLDSAAREEMLRLPDCRETLALLGRCNVLVHGVGSAQVMAAHRGLQPEVMARLAQMGAVAEAFGYYFDIHGKPLYEAPCMGLELRQLGEIRTLVAVAAGARKAASMIGVLRHQPHSLLVTDEGAARAMFALLKDAS